MAAGTSAVSALVPTQAASTVSVTVVSEPLPGSWGTAVAAALEAEAGGACGRLSCVAGIFQYETISCTNCTDSHVVCFGYNCE